MKKIKLCSIGECMVEISNIKNNIYKQSIAGDTLNLPASTAVNARVKLTCVTDDGTNSTWKAEALGTPIPTIG